MRSINVQIHSKSLTIVLLAFFLTFFSSCSNNDDKSSFNQNTLDDAYAAAANVTGLKSLLINYRGELVGEDYFGVDIQNTLYNVRSVTKSIVSILIGIAIENGLLPETNLLVSDGLSAFPYIYEGGKDELTIEHLLTMSSGFEWNEMGGNEYGQWMQSQNKINYVLDKPLINAPGAIFNYNSGTSHLLSVILTDAVGESAFDYAKNNLFDPLGIENVAWRIIGAEYYNGGSDLMLTARDLVKIGTLYLNLGSFEGNQIVSRNWVNRSISSKIYTGRNYYGSEYGYLWWLEDIRGEGCFYAMGYGGQFLFVFPEKELIIVATSNSSTSGDAADQQWLRVYDFIAEQVLSAFL
ncbi:serine hydrolase domain-containing protein [Candidatus Neomarinimicrobiota bacterium]